MYLTKRVKHAMKKLRHSSNAGFLTCILELKFSGFLPGVDKWYRLPRRAWLAPRSNRGQRTKVMHDI